MAIEDVEAIPLQRNLDQRFANSQKWIDSREYCLVKITTTQGVTGWGECWGPIAGNREIIQEYVRPYLVNKDPVNVEEIHDELVFKLRSSYHSYVPASVVSGVDIALWDLRGKLLDQPVHKLLGGSRRKEVEAYATGHFFTPADDFATLKKTVMEEASAHVDAGFKALKQKIGVSRHFPEWGYEQDVELVRAVRESVGDDVRLMVDGNHHYDIASAEKVANEIDEIDVDFFEEPIDPLIPEYAKLNERSPIPIAGGECWAFAYDFERLLHEGGVGYVQPDVTSAGGITSTRRIASTAHAVNVKCYPHVFGSAIALSASLQILATLPGDPLLEFDRTPNPIREDLALDPIRNQGNTVPVPSGPGLGVEIDKEVLAEFRK